MNRYIRMKRYIKNIREWFELIVALIGYVVLHDIYLVGMFSMRYQYANESLSKKKCERVRRFVYLCVSKVLGLYTGTFFS